MSLWSLLLLQETQMKGNIVYRVWPFSSCPLSRSMASSFTLSSLFPAFLYTFTPVFQTLLYFEHEVFFLQLGRGWTAPRLIRVGQLYGLTWAHIHFWYGWDAFRPHVDKPNHILYTVFLCKNRYMTATTIIASNNHINFNFDCFHSSGWKYDTALVLTDCFGYPISMYLSHL